MHVTVMIMMVLGVTVLFLRGGTLHNYLVNQAEGIFCDAGFSTSQEHPKSLPGGGMNFVDLLASRGSVLICVEVETSARNVVSNVQKAQLLKLPIVVLVPNKKVQQMVKKTLVRSRLLPSGSPIYILRLGQLQQAVTNYFPLFSLANSGWENKKTNRRKD